MNREFPITSSSHGEVFGPDSVSDLELWFCPDPRSGMPVRTYGKVEGVDEATQVFKGLFFKVQNVSFDNMEYPKFVEIDLEEVVAALTAEGNDQEALRWQGIIDGLGHGKAHLSFPFNSGDLRALKRTSDDIQ